MKSIEELLAEVRGREMTPEELREQSVSFVYGNLALSRPGITREEVAEAYDALKARGELESI